MARWRHFWRLVCHYGIPAAIAAGIWLYLFLLVWVIGQAFN